MSYFGPHFSNGYNFLLKFTHLGKKVPKICTHLHQPKQYIWSYVSTNLISLALFFFYFNFCWTVLFYIFINLLDENIEVCSYMFIINCLHIHGVHQGNCLAWLVLQNTCITGNRLVCSVSHYEVRLQPGYEETAVCNIFGIPVAHIIIWPLNC